MNHDTCNTYLELLAQSKFAWNSNNDGKIYQTRQRLLDHLIKRFNIPEDEISHLR